MEKVPVQSKLELRSIVAADVSPLQSYANFWKNATAHADSGVINGAIKCWTRILAQLTFFNEKG